MTEDMEKIVREKNERVWRDALPDLMKAATECGYNPYEGKTDEEIGAEGTKELFQIAVYTDALKRLDGVRERLERSGIDTSRFKSYKETKEDDRIDLCTLISAFN